MEVDYAIVIPARMKSSRLPGKPLLKVIGEKTLLDLTYEQASKTKAKHVIVAGCDVEIEEHCLTMDYEYRQTDPEAYRYLLFQNYI